MSSILTNASAMSALSQLSATQRSLRTTQDQVSSGLRIANASDNAAYWSISTAMKSRVSTISALSESLDLTNGILQVASKGLDAVLGAMNGIKDDIVQARQPGIDRNALQADIEARQQVMQSAVDSASFNGVNLIKGDSVEKETSVESVTIDNGNIVSGSGTDTYDISVKGQDHQVVDDYTIDPSDTKTYTTVGKPDYNPNEILKLPLSLDGSGINTFDVDLNSLNMEWGYQYDYDNPFPQPTNLVTQTVTDITDPNSVKTRPGDYLEHNNLAYNQQVPWDDPNDDVLNRVTSLHTINGIYEVNPDNGSLASPGLQFDDDGNRYDYGYDVSDNRPALGEDVTVYPVASISDLSVADRTVVGSDPALPKTYVLTNGDLDNLSDLVEDDIKQVISASAKVASYVDLVADQKDFSSKLQDALTAGVGSLEDADMNVASTRLQALQTQQQLGIQSLSIANQNSQLVLKLFGTG